MEFALNISKDKDNRKLMMVYFRSRTDVIPVRYNAQNCP
ncbi:MAG: hypothetical protein Hyperionvirus2_140 [Hyperionvirus sp.]|uniref:Uncharacterized protein n=1 Tax=Hyperionvirus sp. TaxID=2487770 RepID=A0A3G5A6W2_9VIRU|nr:MAG: hypothetical protein Hyperionvirus2_140 [Hyperionvirus sp.]